MSPPSPLYPPLLSFASSPLRILQLKKYEKLKLKLKLIFKFKFIFLLNIQIKNM